MPFKSKAQINKFRSLVDQGKITQQEFNKWMRETKSPKKLPKKKS